MNSSIASTIDRPERVSWIVRVLEYTELAKPRVISLVLICAGVAGFVAASGAPDLWVLINTLLGTALVAASGSAFNQIIERQIDAKMRRTMERPLPSGRIHLVEATGIGTAMIVVGLVYLWLTTNVATTLLAAITWVLYVGVYTPLKQRTWLNTVVGVIPGALPMLIGWNGTGEPMRDSAWALFLLLLIWQFPHFMAIAWLYRDEYREAGFQMLSANDPTGKRTGVVAVLGAAALLPIVGWMPLFAVDPILLVASAVLTFGQLILAFVFLMDRTDATARNLLRASLIYLPLQLGLIVIFHSGII